MKLMFKRIVFFAALAAIWQLVAAIHLWPSYLFPSTVSVGAALRDGFRDHTFWIALAVTLRRLALAYIISAIVGTTAGVLLATSDAAYELVGSLLISIQSLPSLCWLPLAILWFGLSEKAILFVTVAGSVLAITINVHSGVRNVPAIYSRVGKNLGASGWKLLVWVLLPASLPALTAGLKQGWTYAWRSLISAEMIYVTLGLGQLLMMARDLNDINQVFAVMIVIIATGLAINQLLFDRLEKATQRRWGLEAAV
jgi:NitT/TauT family transport system permease protein